MPVNNVAELTRVYGPTTWDVYAKLDVSLNPEGPDSLHDRAAALIRPGDVMLDAGCRDAEHLIRLVRDHEITGGVTPRSTRGRCPAPCCGCHACAASTTTSSPPTAKTSTTTSRPTSIARSSSSSASSCPWCTSWNTGTSVAATTTAPTVSSHHQLARPRGPVRDVVRRYEAHSIAGVEPGTHRGLPTRALTFQVAGGAPIDIVSMPDASQSPRRSYGFVGGLHTRPAVVAHDGHVSGVGIDMSPLASRRLFGVPAAALTSQVVDLDDLLGPADAAELCDRFQTTPSWHERFAVLDDVLGRAVARQRPSAPLPEVVEAWRCIVASRGAASVETIAAHVGWSRRHLAGRFTAEIGLSPKALLRVVRFEVACELLLSQTRRSIAEAAVEAGYYDQAHMARDWSELAGCSPTRWLAEELHDPPRLQAEIPFVQDVVARAG